MFFDHLLTMGCCIRTTTDSLEDFEEKVKSALSSIKYKWVIALIVNYHSQSKSAKYVLENFTTIDILSKDIDFYFPGYIGESDLPIIPNSESYRNNLLSEAILQLNLLSKEKNVSIERVQEIKSKLRLLKDSHENNDIENFHGDSKKTKIVNKRLGNIWFSEESFAGFVADLIKKTGNHYRYLGGCDLVMIPFFNNELQYHNCSVFNLECIANKETKLSVDEFLLRVIDTLEKCENKVEVPFVRYESYAIAISRFKEFIEDFKKILGRTSQIPEFISNLIKESDNLISRSGKILEYTFHKQELIKRAADLLDDIRKNRDYIISQIVVKEKLESLYKEAIKDIHHASEKDIVSKIISDIEHHVNWKLTEDFYFISYSTKDKIKAEVIRRKLQEQGAKVWMAPDGIPQGRDYSMIIPTTLRYTKNFILILTENSAKSKWVSREIDAAINNSSTLLKIVLADDFQLEQLHNYPDLGFYLNKVQVLFRYEDLIQNLNTFKCFME